MLKYITFSLFIISLLCNLELSAQHTLTGSIEFNTGEAASGAIIRALETDSSTMIDYTTAGEDGNWSLALSSAEPVVLEFRMFGYGSFYELVSSPAQRQQPFRVKLSQESFSLQEVTVTEEAYGMSRKGDTLSFRLNTYTTGAERTLGDVIKRLPGLEVRDGSVFYGGERIDKLLVQGRDIINANHQLATDGIRADQLKEIKIIENYKESSEQFQTQRSEDVAMDVQLKDDQLNKWSGELEALGGYPSSAQADLNLFNFNDKVGLSGFARFNNVGDRVLSYRDMRNMVSNDGGSHFRWRGSQFVDLVPSELSIGDEIQSNTDGIINFNADIDLTNQMKIKGFLMGAYAERESELFVQKEYVSEDQIREENMDRTSKTPIGFTMWKMEWNVDSSTYLEVSVPTSVSHSTVDEIRNGTYGAMDFSTTHEKEEWNYNFAPFAKFRKQVGKDDLWTANTQYQTSRKSGEVLYSDILPFLSVPISPNDSLYRLFRDQTMKSENFNLQTNYKAVLGDWFIEPSLEYSFEDQSIDNEASTSAVRDFSKNTGLEKRAANVQLRGGYETEDWEVAPSVGLNYLKRNYLNEGNAEDVFPGYGLRVVRKFNKAHNFRFNANYGIQYPSLNTVRNNFDIESSTEVSTGGYPIDLATEGYSASMRYRNFIPKKQTFIFARASYSYNEDVVNSYSQVLENYVLNGYLPAPHSQSFSTGFYLGYELNFLPIRLEPNADFSWSEGFTSLPEESFSYEEYEQSYEFEVESSWDFPLNTEIEIEYTKNTQKAEGEENREFSTWQPEIELEYEAGNFRIESDFAFNSSNTRNFESDLYILDLEANYEFKNVPFTLKVEANNVLNLDPRERVISTFGSNVNTVRRYEVFPGYIVAGGTWKF